MIKKLIIKSTRLIELIIYYKKKHRFNNNHLKSKNTLFKKSRIFIGKGFKNNYIYVNNSTLVKCYIKICGNNNKLIIGDMASFDGVNITFYGDNNKIVIGSKCAMQPRTYINVSEATSITIGSNLLSSHDVTIASYDGHRLYTLDGKRKNPAKDVFIGDYVWLGEGCIILKNSYISSHSAVGAHSLVNKSFKEPYSVIAGSPAIVLYNDTKWGI